MLITRQIQDLRTLLAQGSCVTLGNFDGVHNGHRKLIARTIAKAEAAHVPSVVITFSPHPLKVLAGNRAPACISSEEQKIELLRTLNADILLLMPFTHELAALSPEEFVRTMLVDTLHVKELVVGYDYSFGKGRSGDFTMLSQLGERYNYGCERIEPVIIDGAVVSSTRIRDMVKSGDVWNVYPLFERFFSMQGVVEHGMKRGGDLLGFPTANLRPSSELVPKGGVYATWVDFEGKRYKGVTNIGCVPTFGNNKQSIETFIMDFKQEIYGKDLEVHFVFRLRDEKKFDDLPSLMAQIHSDVALAEQILNSPEAQR